MREWTWYENVWWVVKEKVRRTWIFLTTHKCKARGCQRRLEKPYLYCSIECACYDGVYSVRTGWLRNPTDKK